ncbi:phasin family protein [Solwaraspora sp. WMMB335]|uniref:phasin family protein n=1 Tax=Solwaraspora sp. WMMB335 TaxID=3404118 RepID=UPI003B934117
MRDAWRAYLEMALGLTEASRKKAEKTARSLVGKGGATAAQLQSVVEDVLSAGTANRESLTRLVRVEVDRALGAVGLAKADEVTALNQRVAQLERDLEQSRAQRAAAAAAEAVAEETIPPTAADPEASVPGTASTPETAKKAVAKKAVAKKTVAKKTVAKKTPGKKAGGAAAAEA